MSKNSKIGEAFQLLQQAERNVQTAKAILMSYLDMPAETDFVAAASQQPTLSQEENVVEGVFNGEEMVDKDGKTYAVPANYASKSKLVAGDHMKLTITDTGSFLYKQIGPVPRKRLVGTLTYEDGEYKVVAESKAYKVLLASVTYFKGELGDKATILVPETIDSDWACVENFLPKEA